MRIQCRRRSIPVRGLRNGLPVALLALACATALTSAARAQSPALAELLSGVVHMKTFINPDGRTTRTLGREREGSAIVIDSNGLILTIGYLMVEAHSAEVMTNDGQDVPANIVGYDHQTGFGLLQAIAPLKVQPLAFGKSAELKERDAVAPPMPRPRSSSPSANSPAIGNTCSTRRSSQRRRSRPGAGRRCSTTRASWSVSARSSSATRPERATA